MCCLKRAENHPNTLLVGTWVLSLVPKLAWISTWALTLVTISLVSEKELQAKRDPFLVAVSPLMVDAHIDTDSSQPLR